MTMIKISRGVLLRKLSSQVKFEDKKVYDQFILYVTLLFIINLRSSFTVIILQISTHLEQEHPLPFI